ncbi:MAG: peptide chain release factor aRF-1 [Candidatus Aenigmatarchaeota archaeon]
MVIKADTKYKLKKLIEKLDSIRGRGTELVSIYCPHDYDLQEIVNQLREEKGEAQNIKSKRTRKNVEAALSKLVDHLKQYERTPDNGMAAFCGNVSENNSKTDVQLWDIEPPEPITTKLYRCGKEFKLGPLKEMLVESEEYGLLVLDTSEADFGVLQGSRVVPKQHITSIVPGKSKPGGQSAQRYDRVREGLLDDYLKQVGELAGKIFSSDELKGLLVGGPGPIKEKLVDEGHLPHDIKEKIIAIKSTGYTGEQGFQELMRKSRQQLKETKLQEEKDLVEKVLNRLREDGKVAYGLQQVLKSIELGAAETILVSEDLEWEDVPTDDDRLPKGYEEKDIVKVLEKMVEDVGGELKTISRDTQEGEQLYEMGGVAALLRFRIQ